MIIKIMVHKNIITLHYGMVKSLAILWGIPMIIICKLICHGMQVSTGNVHKERDVILKWHTLIFNCLNGGFCFTFSAITKKMDMR